MWGRFKEWFKRQSTGRQYAVVLGAIFAVLLLIGSVSGSEDKSSQKVSSEPAATVAASAATVEEPAADPGPSTAELVAQAHDAVKADDYSQAVTFVAGLSAVKRSRIRRMISRRLATRVEAAVRRGDRRAARRLLRRARRYPQVQELASAQIALSAATQRAALRREARAAAARQREAEREAAAAQEQSQSCEPGYDPCVPPYPPDLDCSELSGPYTVTGSDPHGLDADGDGIGCE